MNATHEMSPPASKSTFATVCGWLAITFGLIAFSIAGIQGHHAGWEMVICFTAPALIASIVAIALRRGALSYVALAFGLVAVLSLFLAA